MTAKPEHDAAAANSSADQGTDAEGGAAPPRRQLPSIIVDPSLVERAPDAIATGHAPPHHNGANGGARAVASAPHTAPASGAELSIADADRFAASIRASWEPPPGSEPAPAAPAQVRPPAVDPAAEAAYARLPGATKRNGWLITAAAVLSFVALGALALSSSRVDLPAEQAAPPKPPAVTAAKPAATRTEAIKPEATQPVAVPAPIEAAAIEPAPAAAIPEEGAPSAQAQAPTAPGTEQAALAEAPAGDPPTQLPPVSPAAPAISPSSGEPTPSPALAVPVAAPAAIEPAPAPVAAAAPQRAAAAPTPPPAPSTVRVRISAVPKHAEITLDGRAIPNPFEADVVVSGKHRVEASALGHRSADVTIAFDQDQKLALRLERVVPTKPRTKPERPRASRAKPASESEGRGAGFVSESPY